MASLIWAVLLLAVSSMDAAVIQENSQAPFNGNQFKFMGSSSSEDSTYFVSQNAAGWTVGNSDCKAFVGINATLANIETEEELQKVTTFFMSSDNTVSKVWLGGAFNINSGKFVWTNGADLGPWAPWSPGHPQTQNGVTKILATTVGGIQFETDFQTQSHRYLCELKSGTEDESAIPCYTDNDLVIVVDASGSIGSANFVTALDFTARLAVTWRDHPGNRVAVIVYSTEVRTIYTLAESLSLDEIRNRIYNGPYFSAGTNSHLGINAAVAELTQGGRGVRKNMVFLTDGSSNDPTATLTAAQGAQAGGIRSFSVGITPSVNQQELLAIAGNDQSHVFNTAGFEDLLKLLKPVSVRVCN